MHDERSTRRLLLCGAVAGPVYLALGLLQVLMRDGFDMRRHALSQLANGDMGWVQIANFVFAGVLVLLGSLAVRRTLRASRGGTWGPLLLALYGIGMLGAAAFVADPAPDFPPGTVTDPGMSTIGLMHFVFGAITFYSIIAATFVFARRFWERRQHRWATYSIFTGLTFLLVFSAVASGQSGAGIMLGLYAVVTLTWIWHSMLHVSLLNRTASEQMKAE